MSSLMAIVPSQHQTEPKSPMSAAAPVPGVPDERGTAVYIVRQPSSPFTSSSLSSSSSCSFDYPAPTPIIANLSRPKSKSSSTSTSSSGSSSSFNRHSPLAIQQTFDRLALEAAQHGAARAGRRRRVGWRVVAWLVGLALEGWIGFCTVRYLVAFILLEPSVLRTLNITFFITSLLALVLLPFVLLLPSGARPRPTTAGGGGGGGGAHPLQLGAGRPPSVSLGFTAKPSAASRSVISSLFAYLALTASTLLTLLTAGSQLAIYKAWAAVPAPGGGFAHRCGWDMDACWGRGGESCEGWRWDGWVGVLSARLAGSAVLFALLALAHIQANRSWAVPPTTSIPSAHPHQTSSIILNAPRPVALNPADRHRSTVTIRSAQSSTLAASAAAFVPPSHEPKATPPPGTDCFSRSRSHPMPVGEKDGRVPFPSSFPPTTAVEERDAAASELAAHKALERARALANLVRVRPGPQAQPVPVPLLSPRPRGAVGGTTGARYLRSTLPAQQQQQQQSPSPLWKGKRQPVANPPPAIAIGLSASPLPVAAAADNASKPLPLVPSSTSSTLSHYAPSGRSTSNSSANGPHGPPSSSASPTKGEREPRRRWSATDVMKRKAVPTFLTLELEADEAATISAEAGESMPKRPSSASATYALSPVIDRPATVPPTAAATAAAPSTPPFVPPRPKRMSRPKSLSPPLWSVVYAHPPIITTAAGTGSDSSSPFSLPSSSEHVDSALDESADVLPSPPPQPRPRHASTPPSKLVDSRLSTLWSGSEGSSSRLSDRRPSDWSTGGGSAGGGTGGGGGGERRSSLWSAQG